MAAKKTIHNALTEAMEVADGAGVHCSEDRLIELAGVLALEKIANAVRSLAEALKELQ